MITTAIGGMVDMVSDEESGLLVTPGSETELTAAMERVLKDDELRHRVVAGAREKVREFTASAVADRLEGIYAQVAPARREGSNAR